MDPAALSIPTLSGSTCPFIIASRGDSTVGKIGLPGAAISVTCSLADGPS